MDKFWKIAVVVAVTVAVVVESQEHRLIIVLSGQDGGSINDSI